jgi:Domain of unknown function (DUF4189)
MNRTFIAAAAAAIAFAAVSIFTVAPAVANNDWASAAGGPSGTNMSWGPYGQQKVESNALTGCDPADAGGGFASNCVIIASSPQCVAVANSPSSGAYAGGTGATAQNAANSAVAALKKKGSRDAQAVPGQDTACSTDPLS